MKSFKTGAFYFVLKDVKIRSVSKKAQVTLLDYLTSINTQFHKSI